MSTKSYLEFANPRNLSREQSVVGILAVGSVGLGLLGQQLNATRQVIPILPKSLPAVTTNLHFELDPPGFGAILPAAELRTPASAEPSQAPAADLVAQIAEPAAPLATGAGYARHDVGLGKVPVVAGFMPKPHRDIPVLALPPGGAPGDDASTALAIPQGPALQVGPKVRAAEVSPTVAPVAEPPAGLVAAPAPIAALGSGVKAIAPAPLALAAGDLHPVAVADAPGLAPSGVTVAPTPVAPANLVTPVDQKFGPVQGYSLPPGPAVAENSRLAPVATAGRVSGSAKLAAVRAHAPLGARKSPAVVGHPSDKYHVSGGNIEFSIPAKLDGTSLGNIPIQIGMENQISVRLGDFLSLFKDKMDPVAFERLSSSSSVNQYVSFDTIRSAGIKVQYDASHDQLRLDSE